MYESQRATVLETEHRQPAATSVQAYTARTGTDWRRLDSSTCHLPLQSDFRAAIEKDCRIQAGCSWVTASSDSDSDASDDSSEQALAGMGLDESNIKENEQLPDPSAEAGPPVWTWTGDSDGGANSRCRRFNPSGSRCSDNSNGTNATKPQRCREIKTLNEVTGRDGGTGNASGVGG
eukprot:3100241-Rhodomonas_salina.2